jgi:PadR family transcriptional regulator PadR
LENEIEHHNATEAAGRRAVSRRICPRLDLPPARVVVIVSYRHQARMTKPSNLLQGTLDLLILRTIQLEPMHGWAIAQQIRLMSKDQLRVGQSALYPALHKLEQQGWIAAEWRVSEKGRQAKYYKLTVSGRKALKTETAQWERLSAAISMIVKPA